MDRDSVRTEIGRLARAGDPEALRAAADALPSTEAYGYERHRARAFALALTGAADSARTSLDLAAAVEPPTTGMLAEDTAQLHLLLGDVPRALAALELALRSDLALKQPASLLAQAVRTAPSQWRRAASLAVASGPRSLAAVGAASLEAYSDRGPFRVGVVLAGLATVVVALLGLPALLNGPDRESPGVTAPEAAAEPHDVIVASPAPRAVRPVSRTASRPAPAPAQRGAARLAAAPAAPAAASRPEAPGPTAPAPAPIPTAPAPAPAPPAPAPPPAAPAPESALAAVPAAAPPPAPPAAEPPHKGRALALGQKRERGEHPPAPPPPQEASAPEPAAVPPQPKEHGNGKGPKP